MLLNARRVRSATGQPALVLLAIEDVTDVKSIERERAARAAAEATTAAKDQVLAVLSHELRTPLTAMLGWTRMLRTRKLDEAATARALEVIDRNTVAQVRLIEVRLERRESAVEISVRDTGKGITPERLPNIFSPLGVVHSRSQSHGGGLGLGLTIVRHLVELHGGAIQAASAGSEQGATFTVTLPLTEEHPARDMEARTIAAGQLASSQLPALDGVRVLIVDDEADMRELLRTILAQCGARVTVAASVREALETLAQATFDVLVSDVRMPEEEIGRAHV